MWRVSLPKWVDTRMFCTLVTTMRKLSQRKKPNSPTAPRQFFVDYFGDSSVGADKQDNDFQHDNLLPADN